MIDSWAVYSDPAANSLYASMLLHASQPYAKMVVKWISTGILQDPYEEFLIKEDARMSKGKLITDYSDEYWDRRYTVGYQNNSSWCLSIAQSDCL